MIKLAYYSMVVVVLCSCQSDINIQDDFGNAVKHNVALQTMQPLRTQPDASDSLDGQKAAQAIERYRLPPVDIDSDSLIED